MKVSLYLPIEAFHHAGVKGGPELLSVARAADEAGFDACSLTDHPIPTAKWRSTHGHDAFDPFAALGYIAAATTRLRLHTNIVVLPYRNPFLTAKCAATVDFLSGGRLILGVAAGYVKAEYEALGVDFTLRGAMMDESLDVLKLAWGEEEVFYEGRNFRAVGCVARPLPIQKPHPPIWGGGNSAPAIRRAAERCDGWSPFFASGADEDAGGTAEMSSMDHVRANIAVLRQHLERAGKARFDISIPLREAPMAYTASEAQRLIDAAAERNEIGANWTLGGIPHSDGAALIEGVRWYGETVLPHIHAMG